MVSAFKQYLGIYTKTKPKRQVILQQPKLTQLGDRTFLVETPVAFGASFTEKPFRRLTPDKAVVRPLAEVMEMYEFADIEGYRLDPELDSQQRPQMCCPGFSASHA